MFSQQYFLTYTVVFTGRIMDCERSEIEEAHIHIFGFTHRKNNQFEMKLMRQNTNYRTSAVFAHTFRRSWKVD